MKNPVLATLICTAFLRTAAAAPDLGKVTDHIHKSFNTPLAMALTIEALKPSGLPGFLAGDLVIGGDASRKQPILLSEDGAWYILGGIYAVGKADIPGFKKLLPKEGLPPPPEILLSPNGELAATGLPNDARLDPDEKNRGLISLAGAAASGPDQAPVVLVTFSDLQCPACNKANEILTKELPAYKGKVRWVYKHYPLKSNHPWAYDAAIAAECARALSPDKFSEMKAAFFAAQHDISLKTVGAKAAEFGEKAGLNRKEFSACYSSKKTRTVVDKDIEEGTALGLQGVPTIFINGRRTRSFSWDEIKATIDEMLGTKGLSAP